MQPQGFSYWRGCGEQKAKLKRVLLVSNKNNLGNLNSISDLKLPLKTNLIGYQSTGSNEIDGHTSL